MVGLVPFKPNTLEKILSYLPERASEMIVSLYGNWDLSGILPQVEKALGDIRTYPYEFQFVVMNPSREEILQAYRKSYEADQSGKQPDCLIPSMEDEEGKKVPPTILFESAEWLDAYKIRLTSHEVKIIGRGEEQDYLAKLRKEFPESLVELTIDEVVE